MGRQEQIIEERLKKLNELRKLGIDPYPSKFEFESYSVNIKEKYSKLANDERTKDVARIAGRIITFRDIGKLIFLNIQDSKGKIQIILQKGDEK